MRFRVIYLALLLFNTTTQTEGQFLPVGSRAMALNGQEAALADHAGTVFYNPALLVGENEFSLWLNYYRPFGLPEVACQAAAIAYRRSGVGLGLGVSIYGNDIFTEQVLLIAAGIPVSGKLILGGKIKTTRIAIDGYGARANAAADLGMSLSLAPDVSLGVLLKNIFTENSATTTEHRVLLSGLRFNLARSGRIYVELAQEREYPPELRGAVEFVPLEELLLRFGTGLNSPAEFAAGFGLRFSHVTLDYALQSHAVLRQTHVFTLSFEVSR